MKGKLAAIAFCLAFALPFGGTGVFASWMIYTMVSDGVRAKEWIRVRAEVTGDSTYRYTWNGATYGSSRLSLMPAGVSSDTDDAQWRVREMFEQAAAERRPITVYVNPDQPGESVVDRTISWSTVFFLVPFALGFGGVGVGALFVLAYIVRAPAERKGAQKSKATSKPASGLAGLWIFAFFWNVISFPIAVLVVEQVLRDREWIGLLVLIFPLIGIVVLGAALMATMRRLRRGRARIEVQAGAIRIGTAVEGHVSFPRGGRARERFNVRLVCERRFENGEDISITPYWSRNITARAVSSGASAQVPFRFEIPAGMPATSTGAQQPVTHRWLVEVTPANAAGAVAETKEIEVLPQAGAAPVAANGAAGFDSLEKLFGR